MINPPNYQEYLTHPLLTVDEVAQLLRVSRITLKRWEKKGRIHPVRINTRGDRRYKVSEIKEMMQL